MAYTTINKSTDYFNTKLYTGAGTSGSPFSLTGVGFAVDWTWIKRRDGASIGHRLFDRVRGATKYIDSSSNSAETTNTSTLIAFGSDGFTLQNEGSVNDGSALFTSWNWIANGQGSSNTDGSINTTYTSANTTAGFSICQYTGTGSNATVGHGLGAVPKMIIVKNTSTTDSWMVYHVGIGSNAYLHLETTNAALSPSTAQFQATTPTSSFFYVGTADGTNKSSSNMIAYCFAEKTGYSKIGSYVGNGSTDGTFVYTGFKPAWLLIKMTTTSGDRWIMLDSKRDTFNVSNKAIYADDSQDENPSTTEQGLDILSNGFKIRNSGTKTNTSGSTYIYMAFAEAPLVGSNNVPCTAR